MSQPTWNTSPGLLETYPYGIPISYQLSASPIFPAISITYKLLSGRLPSGLSINSSGLITGTPNEVSITTNFTFVVRVTDNFNNVSDRTFIIAISGYVNPSFNLPSGLLFSAFDSRWVESVVTYNNPSNLNNVFIRLEDGILPFGLELNSEGIVRGYPNKPVIEEAKSEVNTFISSVNNNIITCVTTMGFEIGRPIKFFGTEFGSITDNFTYYIKEIKSTTTFTISLYQFGPELTLSNDSGFMTVNLSATTADFPVIRTFEFILSLTDGNIIFQSLPYSINIANQNLPISEGGLGIGADSRIPTILNTRPFSFDLSEDNLYYGYYLLPESGLSYSPGTNVQIGFIKSGDYFSFKFIGHDFDDNELTYIFSNLPSNLTADTSTGWVTGTPTLSSPGVSEYTFRVAVYKNSNSSIISSYFNFSFKVYNQIIGEIIWTSPENLGQINNNTVSTLKVEAISDTPLQYQLVSGSLPPNLVLSSNGEIQGKTAYQILSTPLEQGDSTEYTFTVNAFSPLYPVVSANKTFNFTVYQYFQQPSDILYIKATPSLTDRQKINSLLTNTTLIPNDFIYRSTDSNFGKSDSVIYQHAYGINASTLDQYIAAIEKNHYWRNITLGELKTAVARNSNNEIIYEVVYSEIIDNLVNSQNISVSEEIVWPRDIDLQLGPWYTSVTDTFTSYEELLNQEYYTSLTSGSARILYPNSLVNMRTRVGQELGQTDDSNLLPLWMTSTQLDGNTLGFTKSWVICYTKPGFSNRVKNNINNNWQYKLNQINFEIDRFIVNKSQTYNWDNNKIFTNLPNPYTFNYILSGINNTQLQPVSINPLVTVRVADNSIWNITPFPNGWQGFPSATPATDQFNFYVIFEQKTILPNQSQ